MIYLKEALQLRDLGLWPIPVKRGTKIPEGPGWADEAGGKKLLSEEQLRSLFSGDRYELGAVIPPGMIAIDFDVTEQTDANGKVTQTLRHQEAEKFLIANGVAGGGIQHQRGQLFEMGLGVPMGIGRHGQAVHERR